MPPTTLNAPSDDVATNRVNADGERHGAVTRGFEIDGVRHDCGARLRGIPVQELFVACRRQ